MADMSFTIKDNSAQVLAKMNSNIRSALIAIGSTVVEIASDYIMTKYYRPAYQTGDLLRSLTFNVDMANKRVIIGSNLNYAPWVHNGTASMEARPFLRDAIMENMQVWKEVVAEHLGAGWGVSTKV